MQGGGGVEGTLSLFPHVSARIDGRVYDASNATGIFSQWATLGGGSVALLPREPGAPCRVGVGTDAPVHRLHVEGGNLYVSGEVLALSDARRKRDLCPLRDALARARALTGYTYAAGADSDSDSGPARRHVGLLAQDVARVLPEAVHEEGPGGPLSLAYGNLVALLVEALKELAERVERLEQQQQQQQVSPA
jgi:hypothetical protein